MVALCFLLIFFIHFLSSASGQTFYSLTRFFFDLKKENGFEDISDFRQRFFFEYSKENRRFGITFSGKIDINYFFGGFPRFEQELRIHELYITYFREESILSVGKKIISWGNTDGSPLDVVNRPDFTEGFFNEPRFTKNPSFVISFLRTFGNNSIEFIYEPFFTPPLFKDIGGDWALLNWGALNSAFQGDKNDTNLKTIVDGQINPVVKAYPSDIEDVLMSFALGLYFSSRVGVLTYSTAAYTGYSVFPVPFFDELFVADFARTPGTLSQKFDVSALEFLEPVQRGESFVKLLPKRYYMLGGGGAYDISGYLIKGDVALYLLANIPDENLFIREFNILSISLDIEREVIPNLFLIPGIRGIVKISPQQKLMLISNGIALPTITSRYEFYLGTQNLSILGNLALDIPSDKINIRSSVFSVFATWKPRDIIELSLGLINLSGDDVSLFGFFKENSAFSFSLRLYM